MILLMICFMDISILNLMRKYLEVMKIIDQLKNPFEELETLLVYHDSPVYH